MMKHFNKKDKLFLTQEEFNNKWFCDAKNLADRIILVNEEWEYIVNKYPEFKEHLKRPVLPLKFVIILTSLKPVTDKMLLDAVWANIDVLYLNKSKNAAKKFNQTITKIFSVFSQFIDTPEYKKMLVEKEVTGEDTLLLGNKTVQISHNAILQHIERLKANPLLSKEILDIQDDWENFVEKRHKCRINGLEKEMQNDAGIETNEENDFIGIFKDNGYSVFRLLNEKYQSNNKKLRAKYSYLYHYLKYEDLIRCNQLEYIDFIKTQFGVEMSKILPKTLKYEDDIQYLLAAYHKKLK